MLSLEVSAKAENQLDHFRGEVLERFHSLFGCKIIRNHEVDVSIPNVTEDHRGAVAMFFTELRKFLTGNG